MMDKNREAFAKENGMTMEFVNWFFDRKKEGCGSAWFMMAAAMWEGWKSSREEIDFKLPAPNLYLCQGSAEAAILDIAGHLTSLGIRVKGNEE